MHLRGPVIVTGAGRSGTSAVARVLHESGFPMGRDFAPPSEYNPRGFYEELPVLRINDAIVMECRVDQPGTWPSRDEALAVAEKHAQGMADVVATLDGGWKDPRFCLTLEAWLPHLPSKPRLIVCLRSPAAEVESGLRPYGAEYDEGARRNLKDLWCRYNERLLELIEAFDLEATSVEYDELLERPREVVARLSDYVGVALDERYVEVGLRHFRAPVEARFAPLYRRVKALARA